MYYVMESKTDVIISYEDQVKSNEVAGFKVVGVRKTTKGAERLAEKRCSV